MAPLLISTILSDSIESYRYSSDISRDKIFFERL